MSEFKKPKSGAQSYGMSQRSQFVAAGFLLAIGATLAFFGARANAMSQVSAGSGEIQSQSVSGNLHCEIVADVVSERLKLNGVVWSSVPIKGSYSFTVRNQGSGGGSNVAQSGLFQAMPNEKSIVGMVMLSTSGINRYDARLSARSDQDEVVCDTRLK